MKILQLCAYSLFWPKEFKVESIDLRTGKDVLTLNNDFGQNFDAVISAPPCDQFSKANSQRWEEYPAKFIDIAYKCLHISVNSGKPWILENPPGRIEKFLPELTMFRILTWQCSTSKKEYILYSNLLLLKSNVKRYSATPTKSNSNMSKKERELWEPGLVLDMANWISL